MKRLIFPALAFSAAACLLGSDAFSQAPIKSASKPRLDPVAETRLLMDGLARVNLRGLEKILVQNAIDDAAWTFARGQALLLAETGNLLMLRPPRNQGVDLWFDRSGELRQNATSLAQALAQKNLEKSRVLLRQLAGSCNRCHQSFRVPQTIEVFAVQPGLNL